MRGVSALHLVLVYLVHGAKGEPPQVTGGASTKTRATSTKRGPPQRPQAILDALERNEPIYYFGLGSNMSRQKLENRSICGTKIHIQRMEPAVVSQYRLAFNLRGFPPLEPGMGSLEPVNSDSAALLAYHGDECHGALIKLTPSDYEKVMRSEGINGDKNQGYEEVMVTAIPYNKFRRPVQAVALRARDHVRLKRDPCPSRRYMKILREGAKELGLKPCYQDFLEQHPVQQVPPFLRKIAIHNLVVTFMAFRLKIRFLSRIQSWLLFQFYVPSNAGLVSRCLSEIATLIILLPGALAGWLILTFMRFTGKSPPPMLARLADNND